MPYWFRKSNEPNNVQFYILPIFTPLCAIVRILSPANSSDVRQVGLDLNLALKRKCVTKGKSHPC